MPLKQIDLHAGALADCQYLVIPLQLHCRQTLEPRLKPASSDIQVAAFSLIQEPFTTRSPQDLAQVLSSGGVFLCKSCHFKTSNTRDQKSPAHFVISLLETIQPSHLREDQRERDSPKLKSKLAAEPGKNLSLLISAQTSSYPARTPSNQKGTTGK